MSDRALAATKDPRASVLTTDIGMGMISPATPFVTGDLNLAPISFRFLFMLWKTNSDQDARITAIEARLTAAGIP